MTLLRLAGILTGVALVAGCVSYKPTDDITVSAPCSPNIVSVAFTF